MNSKEKISVHMLNHGVPIAEIVQKMRVNKTWLELQKERIV